MWQYHRPEKRCLEEEQTASDSKGHVVKIESSLLAGEALAPLRLVVAAAAVPRCEGFVRSQGFLARLAPMRSPPSSKVLEGEED